MASNPIDYTSRDFDAYKASMLEYARTVFPDWAPSSEGDFGVMLVELFAYAADITSYYTDRVSQEAYIGTATQRVSMLNIAELLGYVPSNGVPSTATVNVVTDNPGNSVVIPAGTQFLTDYVESIDAPIVFESDVQVTVAGNGGTAALAVTQGETLSLVTLGDSTGIPEQQFGLPDLHVIDGSIHLFVETISGLEEWTEIAFLVDANPDDKVFSVRTDDKGRTIITLGDGVNGFIPTQSLTVYATYRIGVGAAANLPAGSIQFISTNIAGITIAQLGDGTFNTTAATGGADQETIEQIRVNAPLAFRTQFRAVTVRDFHDLALKVPGVINAHAVANHYTSVTLYIIGAGGAQPNQRLKDSVLDYFEDKTLSGVSLSILGPTYVPINVGSVSFPMLLQVKKRYSRPEVLSKVTTAIQALYSQPNIDFGMYLTVADIYHTAMAVEGVDWVNVPMYARNDAVQTGAADIQLREQELPSPGTITITATGGIG